ncbi:MAG TPA: hypothetical protein VEW69_12740, partial [Alphaproteobacteria bacterium]|nr:hypothetical protein [Alphaproteobacteria bacterium]
MTVPYTFEFDAKNKILRGYFRGSVTDQIVIEFYGRTYDFVARYDARAVLTDLTDVTTFDVSAATVQSLARRLPAPSNNPDFVRIIVASDPHVFGMVRMFQILGDQTRPLLHVV